MGSFNSTPPVLHPNSTLKCHAFLKKGCVSVGLADIDVGVISPNGNLPLCDLKRHVTLSGSSC